MSFPPRVKLLPMNVVMLSPCLKKKQLCFKKVRIFLALAFSVVAKRSPRNVLGSEKIRLMERKMNIAILDSAYFPTKTLQNELCWMKIGQSSQKIQSFEVESQHST